MRTPLALHRGWLVGVAGGLVSACGAVAPVNPEAERMDLPAGPGRATLERECLNCHELDALELFREYYGQSQWRSLVLTMRDNGARVEDGEVDDLAAYLSRYFGTGD